MPEQTEEVWLVCGSRNKHNAQQQIATMRALQKLADERGMPSRVVHGAAFGFDSSADLWAKAEGIQVDPYPAAWRVNGVQDLSAGIRRNGEMLELAKPTHVIAFPGGSGTEDMKSRARAAGVPVIELKI